MEQGELVRADILGKLRGLRQAICSRLLLEGVAWLVLALVAVVFATLALDYLFRLERPLRAIVMALAGVGLLAVVWRELILPLRVPMDSAELALLVERRFRQLGDRLIGAIQFARPGRCDEGVSRAMVARMAQEANTLAGPLPFREVVQRGGMLRVWAVAACAGMLLLGFGLWRGDILSRWFKRNVLFAEIAWPQSTYLSVRGGPDFTVLRGDDLEVIIDVEPRSDHVPHTVTLHARYPSVGRTEETVEADADNPMVFRKVFPAVAEEFEFHVTGGDDRRDRRRPHGVRLIDPPALRNVRFTVAYPSYMNRPRPDRMDGARGLLAVPVGASVTVEAESNKPLTSASIVLDDKPVQPMRPLGRSDGDANRPGARQFIGLFEIAGQNKSASQVLRFALKDTDGYTNRRGAKYMIQVLPDLAPLVDLKKLRIGLRISPRAVLPLQVVVRDDHGIASADMLLARSADAKDPNSRPIELPPDVGREFDTAYSLDLDPFRLVPGNTIYVTARSTDSLPSLYGGPNRSTSGVLSFSIVKPEDLMSEFVQRQKEIRLEFEQAKALQESARAKTGGAATVFAGGQVTPEAQRLLSGSGALQTSVGAEIAKVAESLNNIVEEMKNNRVGTETGREQIRDGVVKPLEALGEPVRKVTAAIHAARSVTDAAPLADQTRAIEDIQKDIARQMDDILQRMAKLESKQDLANKLQLIIKWSEQLMDAIKPKQEKEVGKVFEPTTQPGDGD